MKISKMIDDAKLKVEDVIDRAESDKNAKELGVL